MSRIWDVIIVGGGLAGAAAATLLARAGRRVLVFEKATYPADKLCGEFLSTEVAGLFGRLGALEAVRAAGACDVDRVRMSSMTGAAFEAPLPGRGLALSRRRLDGLLLDKARAAGADAREGTPVRAIDGDLREGFRVTAGSETFDARVVLGAYGKRSALDRRLGRPFLAMPGAHVGFKAHFRGEAPAGVVELHAFPGGYCGLVVVEDGLVNVCWITTASALREAGGRPEAMLAHTLPRNAELARRLSTLTPVREGFVAGGQLHLAPKTPFAGDVCMVGDTAGMIAPLCGDGMAMALHAAFLAAPAAEAFLSGEADAPGFRARYEAEWRKAFGLRMRLGGWIHAALSRPPVASATLRAAGLMPPLARWVIRRTRG